MAELLEMAIGDRDIEKTVATNDGDIIKVEQDEVWQAYQQIKSELGVAPVRIVVISDEMKFKNVAIDVDTQLACVVYEYAGRNITYTMQCLFADGGWGADVEEEPLEEYMYDVGKVEVLVKEYELPKSGIEKYVGKFKYCDVEYQLAATMEKEEFELLLDNLYFW